MAPVGVALGRRGGAKAIEEREVALTGARKATRLTIAVVRPSLAVPAFRPRAITALGASSALGPSVAGVRLTARVPTPVPAVVRRPVTGVKVATRTGMATSSADPRTATEKRDVRVRAAVTASGVVGRVGRGGPPRRPRRRAVARTAVEVGGRLT